MTVGENIRAKRTRKKMTLHDLAAECGIAVSTLSRYETGHIDPQLGALTRLAMALGCSARDLVPTRVRP